jgi:hypothetical protein
MKSATLRLGLAALAFAAWIGWLAYLVCSMESSLPPGASRPVVLSRPQFLVSSLDVIADVREINTDPAEVTVRQILWPETKEAQDLVGKQIRVSHLSECHADWLGPGEYILALQSLAAKGYQVVPLPRSPGFPAGRPRIYPSTPETRRQVEEIRKTKG